MRAPRLPLFLLALLALAPALFAAGLRLAAPLSDHMVLQREKAIAVWGWADASGTRTLDSHVKSLRAKIGAGLPGVIAEVQAAPSGRHLDVHHDRRRAGVIDQQAAALILQGWLDAQLDPARLPDGAVHRAAP